MARGVESIGALADEYAFVMAEELDESVADAVENPQSEAKTPAPADLLENSRIESGPVEDLATDHRSILKDHDLSELSRFSARPGLSRGSRDVSPSRESAEPPTAEPTGGA